MKKKKALSDSPVCTYIAFDRANSICDLHTRYCGSLNIPLDFIELAFFRFFFSETQ